MGIFHYPRINVKGLLQINVGTANNDDYSSDLFPPGSPYAGQPVRLADSITVQPLTYGMTDAEWNKWAVTPLTVQVNPSARFNKSEGASTSTLLPGEWNFYGDMGLIMADVKVTGITDPGNLVSAPLKAAFMQGELSFNNRADATGRSTGMIIDVNPEDSNNSQIFADFLSFTSNGSFLFSGKPSKAMTRWINFQRNLNLTGPNGAAATFQVTVPLSELKGQPILSALPAYSPEGAKLAGIVFRYTIYRAMQVINVFKYAHNEWMQEMIDLYKTEGLNPDFTELQGTIAPWFEDEPVSCPVGRLLNPTVHKIPTPPDCRRKGSQFSLAPAVVYINWQSKVISVDFSASFPDWYKGNYDPLVTGDNPKWDFGPLFLAIIYNGASTSLGAIQYANGAQNDKNGYVFDFPFNASDPVLKKKLQEGTFSVISSAFGSLLAESTYFIVSDQSGLYTEQSTTDITTDKFRNDGEDLVSASFLVYKKGLLLTPADPETLALWCYDTTPNQAPGNRTPLIANYKSGQPIPLRIDRAGNRVITAVIDTYSPPPVSYGDLNSGIVPLINIRILPFDDYSEYYIDPSAPQPVGNARLTFDVIYQKVLRNYYLLYPAMSQHIALNDPQEWSDAEMAGRLMQRISLPFWGRAEAMPRTRDLSQSRRVLLTAWCLKFFQNK